MASGEVEPDLTAFQLQVARLFFSLPASGFLLAGGAALSRSPTPRPPNLLFPPDRGQVPTACDALETAWKRGWTTQRIHESDTFCRIVIRSADAGVLVDLAVNAPPDPPPPRLPPGQRLHRKNSRATSCSPCLTGLPHGTSPTCTCWRISSARPSCSHAQLRLTQGSTPACSQT